MLLGVLGLVPTKISTMVMMVVTGVLMNIHFWSLKSDCDQNLHPFVRLGIPWIAASTPFVNGIAVLAYDKLVMKRTFKESMQSEEDNLNNFMNKMNANLERKAMQQLSSLHGANKRNSRKNNS